MTTARVGTLLLIGGALLLALSIVLLALYGGIGTATAPGLLLATSMAVIGAGGAAVSLAGAGPLAHPFTRVGVGILSIGLLSMPGFSFVNGTQGGGLESAPLVLFGGVGLLGIFAGVLVTAASFAWRGLRHRP